MLLLALPGAIAQEMVDSLLRVQAVEPAPRAVLGLTQAIHFRFNHAVDCSALETAWQVQPPVPGQLHCSGYSLRFQPSRSYQAEAVYSFGLRAPLQARNGALMPAAFRVEYRSASPLEVREVSPQASAGLAAVDSAITVIFDRPVVPLPLALAAEQPQPLRLEPAVAGSGEWINSAIYSFRPSQALASDRLYRASIAPGLRALDGAGLAQPYSWSFRTAVASIIAIEPSPGESALPLQSGIQLRFSQVMPRKATEGAFSLRAAGAGAAPVPGDFAWAEDGMGFSFQPHRALRLATSYRVSFDSGLLPALDLSVMPAGGWRYKTAPLPAIVGSEPADGELGAERYGFSLFFASAMAADSLRDRIEIAPEPADSPSFRYSAWENRYIVSFAAEPSTDYRIVVAPGAEDSYGNAINEPFTWRYRTGPRSPALGFEVSGPVGFYPAGRGAPQITLMHRGAERIDMALYRVPLESFVRSLTQREHHDPADAYVPGAADLLQRWQVSGRGSPNDMRYEQLDLDELAAPAALTRGVYFLRASAPELAAYAHLNRHFLQLATAALTLKVAANQLTIWAVDTASGMPIAGEEIAVYAAGGQRIASGISDERGILQLDITRRQDLYAPLVAVLESARYFGLGSSGWSHGLEPSALGHPFLGSASPYQSYLYTDRDWYRRGQTVHFRGILRRKEDMRYPPAAYASVPVSIRDAQGEVQWRRQLALSEFGSFHGDFLIPLQGELGAYTLSLDLPGEEAIPIEGAGISFRVADYQPPEFELNLSMQPQEIAAGETAELRLDARYFFGGEVAHAPGDYRVIAQPYFFEYRGEGAYEFVDSDLLSGERDTGAIIREGSLHTDARGQAQLGLQARAPVSQRWQIEVSLQDEALQPVTSRAQLLLHQGLHYIGARAEDRLGTAGKSSRIQLIAVDWESQPLPGQRLEWRVGERRWTEVARQDPATGATEWIREKRDIALRSGAVQTDASGKAQFAFVPPRAGQYKVTVTSRDRAGNRVQTATYLWVAGGDDAHLPRHEQGRIELVPDKRSYRVGERARVLIRSPFLRPAQALLSLERGDVLETRLLTLRRGGQVIELDIRPEHAPNIFLQLLAIQPGTAGQPALEWRFGMTQLLVDSAQHELHIEIQAGRDIAAPQDELELRLRVRDAWGAPVQAELGIALTDAAELTLLPGRSPSLFDTFFGLQPLGVRSASALSLQAGAAVAGGAGHGGGFYAPASVELRDEFLRTAYWKPSVVTDATGEAGLRLRLPDTLSTWRLDVRGLSSGRDGKLLVGDATQDIVSRRPLLLRPVTPRFFVEGDRVRLGAILHNNTGQALRAIVALENRAGLQLAAGEAQQQSLVLGAGERQSVHWWVTVGAVDEIAPQFVLRSADGIYTDASIAPASRDESGSLPVYRYHASAAMGRGALYYSAHLHLQQPVRAAVNRGIGISRSYRRADDATGSAIHSASVGEQLQVRLQITVPSSLRYVVIEDFLPAGTEVIDPVLESLAQSLRPPSLGALEGIEQQGWGWWYFDSAAYHDERVLLYASELPRGVYEFVYSLRPTIAGSYRVRPAQARQLYFPEVYGRGAGAQFEVIAAPGGG